MPNKLPDKAGSSMSALSHNLRVSADISTALYNYVASSRNEWTIADYLKSEGVRAGLLSTTLGVLRDIGFLDVAKNGDDR
jgi:hypothetical protein